MTNWTRQTKETDMISVKDRAQAVTRAKRGLRHLEDHPQASRGRLGAARDQLNIASTWRDAAPVWDAVSAIEASVVEVCGQPLDD